MELGENSTAQISVTQLNSHLVPRTVTSHLLPKERCPCPVQESAKILISLNQNHARIMINITLKGGK